MFKVSLPVIIGCFIFMSTAVPAHATENYRLIAPGVAYSQRTTILHMDIESQKNLSNDILHDQVRLPEGWSAKWTKNRSDLALTVPKGSKPGKFTVTIPLKSGDLIAGDVAVIDTTVTADPIRTGSGKYGATTLKVGNGKMARLSVDQPDWGYAYLTDRVLHVLPYPGTKDGRYSVEVRNSGFNYSVPVEVTGLDDPRPLGKRDLLKIVPMDGGRISARDTSSTKIYQLVTKASGLTTFTNAAVSRILLQPGTTEEVKVVDKHFVVPRSVRNPKIEAKVVFIDGSTQIISTS